MSDDLDLLRRYADGDPAAFDQIVERYERRVFSIALRMCGNREDARDVTQDVFVNALRALRRFRGEAQLGTWFHRVAVNASLDMLRRAKTRPTAPLEAAGDAPASDPGPDVEAERAQRAAAVHTALAKISDEHRAVLVLYEIEGLDYAEVADALGVPVGTVKSRIHRARIEMARLLGHLRDEPSREPSAPARPLKEEK